MAVLEARFAPTPLPTHIAELLAMDVSHVGHRLAQGNELEVTHDRKPAAASLSALDLALQLRGCPRTRTSESSSLSSNCQALFMSTGPNLCPTALLPTEPCTSLKQGSSELEECGPLARRNI